MRWPSWVLLVVFMAVIIAGSVGLYTRYQTSKIMHIRVLTLTPAAYPDNPATLSQYAGIYAHNRLILTKEDATHVDFTFLPANPQSATIHFKHIDVSLMTPGIRTWVKFSPSLTRIALTDRQWNRQQVSFEPTSSFIEVTGGDGFEKTHLYSAELAKNCLNAGLWEVLLYTQEHGQKTLYAQGWFRFPLGYYRQLVEYNTGLPYWRLWYYLEHWYAPQGVVVNLSSLRSVVNETKVPAFFNPQEPIQALGEQLRKQKDVIAPNVHVWGDYVTDKSVAFARFIPPGIYQRSHPWGNEYWRLAHFDGALFRNIISPAEPTQVLQELSLVFSDAKGRKSTLIMSGFSLSQLPHLDSQHYDEGFFMPMGIGTPPVNQTYTKLIENPPERSPLFSMYLDEHDVWINHHKAAIDGLLIFIDKNHPQLLHVYIVSYEREAVIAHIIVELNGLPSDKTHT